MRHGAPGYGQPAAQLPYGSPDVPFVGSVVVAAVVLVRGWGPPWSGGARPSGDPAPVPAAWSPALTTRGSAEVEAGPSLLDAPARAPDIDVGGGPLDASASSLAATHLPATSPECAP